MSGLAAVQFLEQPCRTALNRVSNMSFKWSLNPYMGCAHRCTFCSVASASSGADRPFDDRYRRTVRVKRRARCARLLQGEHEQIARIVVVFDDEDRYVLARARVRP